MVEGQKGIEYAHLVRTVQRRAKEVLNAPIVEKYRNPFATYQGNLELLCQTVDRSMHAAAREGFRKTIKEAGVLPGSDEEGYQHVRATRVKARYTYIDTVSKESVFPAVRDMVNGSEANRRYRLGFEGGNKQLDATDWKEFEAGVDSLHGLDPRTAAYDMLREELLSGSGRKDENRVRLVAFKQVGLSETSPEYQLMLLAALEIRARGHMLEPLYRGIKKYAAEPPVGFVDDKKVPNTYAVAAIGRIILGKQEVNTFKGRDSDQNSESFNGTEYYRGLEEMLSGAYSRLLTGTYGEDAASSADRVVKALMFMRTTPQQGISSVGLLHPVVSALASRDFTGARETVLNQMIRYPDLYHTFVADALAIK